MSYRIRREADGSLRNLTMVAEPSSLLVGKWERQWASYLDDRRANAGITAHWEWRVKQTYFAHRPRSVLFGGECAGRCQGMMIVSWPKPSRLTPDSEVAYVDFLETAPWNRTDVAGDREFRGVGQNLLYAGYDLSEALGYRGRLGLTALREAEPFYRRIGMVERGVGERDERSLTYFKFTEAAARRFRTG